VRDDSALRDALAADLDRSYEGVVLAFQHRLYAFALRMCGDPRDAEEIVQDALVRAYRALARYPPDRRRALALRAWLYRITLNVTRNRLRGRRRPVVPLDTGAVDTPADASARPAAVLERAERRRMLAKLVAELPQRYRAAVVLRHVEGLGYAEIAAALAQPEGTVKANVHRGLALLRRALGEEDAR
jgi:RNA polymerase sigma-70 factor (ECF subfamily)